MHCGATVPVDVTVVALEDEPPLPGLILSGAAMSEQPDSTKIEIAEDKANEVRGIAPENTRSYR